MSAIFQEAPPQVIVHPLPRTAKYFTYSFRDLFRITAWMPESMFNVSETSKQSNDSFYDENCRGCERNCESYLDDYLDSNGDVDWDEVGPHCDVWNDGYHGQDCPLGFEREDEDFNFDLSEIAFMISMRYKVNNRNHQRNQFQYSRYEKAGDSAFLCNSKIEEGCLMTTPTCLPSNVFGSDSEPGLICWGRVIQPKTLRGIVSNFNSSQFNNDLVKIDQFESNSNRVKGEKENYASYRINRDEHILHVNSEDEPPVDSLVIVDAEYHVHAFFTLLCAGFKPQTLAPHVILIPAREVQLEKNGMTFIGYKTIPDDLGKEWFISQDKLLVGQI